MWLKIIKTIYVVAKATGLDQKVKGWVIRRLNKAANNAIAKLTKAQEIWDEVEPYVEQDKD